MLTSLIQPTRKQIVAVSSAANEVLYTVPEGKTFVGYILSQGGTWYGYNMIPAGAVASNSNFIGTLISNPITLISGTIIKIASGSYSGNTILMGTES